MSVYAPEVHTHTGSVFVWALGPPSQFISVPEPPSELEILCLEDIIGFKLYFLRDRMKERDLYTGHTTCIILQTPEKCYNPRQAFPLILIITRK